MFVPAVSINLSCCVRSVNPVRTRIVRTAIKEPVESSLPAIPRLLIPTVRSSRWAVVAPARRVAQGVAVAAAIKRGVICQLIIALVGQE